MLLSTFSSMWRMICTSRVLHPLKESTTAQCTVQVLTAAGKHVSPQAPRIQNLGVGSIIPILILSNATTMAATWRCVTC